MARQDNPFPSDAVATSSLEGLPDYPTRYSIRAEEKIDNYLEDFDLQGKRASLILGVRGRYGSGKTHLVLHAMEYLARKSSEVPAAGTDGGELHALRNVPSKAIYSKANVADLYDIYKNHIAAKLKQADLKQLIAYHYQRLLDERTASATPSIDRETSLVMTAKAVREQSDENPEYILELLRKDLLPVADLPLEFSRQLRATEPSAGEDFFKAYSRIDSPEFAGLADRWIHGGELNDTEMRQLGVSVHRIDPKLAREALRFLLNAYRRAGVAFLFCIDEFERFRLIPAKGVVEGSSDLDREAVRGVLKDLAEIFDDCGQIFIVSGTVDAWGALPEDVRRARFIPEDTIDVRLDPDEARSLLQEYCRAKRRSLTGIFQQRALELLLEEGEHNARKLLQIAHQAYKIGERENRLVAEQDIPQAASKAFGDIQRIDQVQDTIRAVAKEMGLTCLPNAIAGGKSHTFAIGDITRPIAFVEVLRSVFKLEEVEQARVVAAATTAVVAENPQAQVCAVIVGYSSHEVRQELAQTVTRVLIYEEDKFASDFRAFLQKATAPAPPVAASPPTYNPARFDKFEDDAREELDRLRQAVSELTTRQQAEKETVRVERVGPKLEDVLAYLETLVHAEEDVGTDAHLSGAASSEPVEPGTLERLTSNLKTQRQLIVRARRLNGGQPREQAFGKLLTDYSKVLDASQAAAATGTDTLVYKWPGSYRQRCDLLRDIRRFQNVRKQIGALGRTGSFIAPTLWLPVSMRVLLVFGILLVLATFATLTASWIGQKSANRDFVKELNSIEYPTESPTVSGRDDVTYQTYQTYQKIKKALNDFEIASPSRSPATDNLGQEFSHLGQSDYGGDRMLPSLGTQMEFIDRGRRYLASMTMLQFFVASTRDPAVYAPILVAFCLIGIPAWRLLRIHWAERLPT